MSDPRENSEPLENRLTRIESALMHLQHDLDQLHEAFVGGQSDFAALRRELTGLARRVDIGEAEPEVRDPLAEKPPHY